MGDWGLGLGGGQALEEHSGRQLRMMFLLQPWDKVGVGWGLKVM